MTKKAFIEMLLAEWERLQSEKNNVTLWDAFISLTKDRAPVYLLTLKADIGLVKYIASGYTIAAIHRMTGIPSIAIREVAFTWGLEPLEETLDFDAFLVYNIDMTGEQLANKMNELLPIRIQKDICDLIIRNIERYLDLEEILKEEDN